MTGRKTKTLGVGKKLLSKLREEAGGRRLAEWGGGGEKPGRLLPSSRCSTMRNRDATGLPEGVKRKGVFVGQALARGSRERTASRGKKKFKHAI